MYVGPLLGPFNPVRLVRSWAWSSAAFALIPAMMASRFFRDVAFYARNNSEYQPIHTGAWHVMVKRGFNRRHKLSKAHAGVDRSLECPNDWCVQRA